jgi:hypothetical protein
MKRSWLAALFLSLLLVFPVFAFTDPRTAIYDTIKTETLKGLKASFKRDIKIGKLEGMLLGSVVLKEVEFPGFFTAPNIYIRFNPATFAVKRDIIPAITTLTAVKADFKIERDKNNQWNLFSLLPPPEPGAPPPPVLQGIVILKNCRVNYHDRLGFQKNPQSFSEPLENVNGEINFTKKDTIVIKLDGKTVDGSYLNFFGNFNTRTGKFLIKVAGDNLILKKWGNYLVAEELPRFESGLAGIDLQITSSQKPSAPVNMSGNYTFSQVSANSGQYSVEQALGDFKFINNDFFSDLSISRGKIFAQELSGETEISFRNNRLSFDLKKIVVYGGTLRGNLDIALAGKMPQLSFKGKMSELNLALASQSTPGIEGYASGEIKLSGPINNLQGDFFANLRQARLFGQPLDKISAALAIKAGDFYVEKLAAISSTAAVYSSGKITRDLVLDFHANARGIKLSGKSILGEMETTVDNFDGNLKLKLDKIALASPLKNMRAEGEVSLSRGKIGAQHFDSARGKIFLGEGLIRIEDLSLRQANSLILVSGQTGIGFPTKLKISGSQINLEDLKIINLWLPAEERNPSGLVAISAEVSGALPKETRISSFDPLLDLDYSMQINLQQLKLASFPVVNSRLNLEWKAHRLYFSNCSLKMPLTEINFNLQLAHAEDFSGDLKGTLDLSEFGKLTAPYGKVDGTLGLNFIFNHQNGNPSLSTSFWLKNLIYNSIAFNEIRGGLSYTNQNFKIVDPLQLTKGPDQYAIAGNADLSGEGALALNFEIRQAEFASFYTLVEELRSEFIRRFSSVSGGKKLRLRLSSFLLPHPEQFSSQNKIILYSSQPLRPYFLQAWGKIYEDFEKSAAAAPTAQLGGEVRGKLNLQGTFINPSANFEGEVKQGFFRNFNFDSLTLAARLLESKLVIDQAELTKEKGKLSAQGEIDAKGKLSLALTAQNMSLEILKTISDQDFRGNFNLNASLDGPLQNPNIAAALSANRVVLAGLDFDNLSMTFSKRKNRLSIEEFSLLKGEALSRLSGSIDYSPEGQIDLEANFNDDALGLFNLFSGDQVRWRAGKASLKLKAGGTMKNPQLSGEVQVKEAAVYLKAIDSEIKQIAGEARIDQNSVIIDQLYGFWQGNSSRGYPNQLAVSGKIDLSDLLAKKSLAFDLTLNPTQIYVDLPNLITGTININQAQLSGLLAWEQNRWPTLRGAAEVNNALLTLSSRPPGEKPAVPLNLDLNLSLNKNVYATMGDIATMNLSYIFMNLEINCDTLQVAGNLAAPSLAGRVALKRGTLTLLNREFSLLSTDQQTTYYGNNPEKISENVAVFKGGEGAEGMQPEANITAQTQVENAETDSSGNLVKKKVIILSRLRGVIGTTDKDRGLNINFDSFSEDSSRTPAEIRPASYSDSEIKVMLLPEIIRSLIGVSKTEGGKQEKVDTNVFLADYLTSQVQTFLFRRVERELESRLGLESLTLEYNVGKDIRQAMRVSEPVPLAEEKPDWRVGFVKGFFDKFFIDVRYSQWINESNTSSARTSINYQLTYKLSPIWSIIYYREPLSVQELATGYQKVTLKAGFSFK